MMERFCYYVERNLSYNPKTMPRCEKYLVMFRLSPDTQAQRIKAFRNVGDAMCCAVDLNRARERYLCIDDGVSNRTYYAPGSRSYLSIIL